MVRLPRLLVIVGPTASGKTGLAVKLAKKLDGEIVSADSRLLYRGMDIGTAKPTKKEMAGVPHHLIDIVSPEQTLTLAEYKHKALDVIQEILRRGKLPILVGGTGLYVRAVVDNLKIPEVPPDPALRARLEAMPRLELFAWLHALDPAYAKKADKNPRYAIRALEVVAKTGQPFSELQGKGEPLFDAVMIGLKPADSKLEDRISKRISAMTKKGLVKEVQKLLKRHGNSAPALSGIGYRELFPYLKGEMTLKEVLEQVRLHTRQYAKRQMTWFRPDPRIAWVSTPEKGFRLALKKLKRA
jgi:tRNA dimethylallyltransferase